MQRLLTISYPEVSAKSAEFIAAFRQKHDARWRTSVEAHFTLVFGCDGIALDEYTKHIASVATSSTAITFTCKYAMLGADDEDDTAYVFLVPDQGYAGVSLLHDRLYTGPLSGYLRLDLPYVPHITIGTLSSRTEAKTLCDQLNQQGLCIEGRLTSLVVGTLEDGRFKNLSAHALGEA